ncbi:MAG: type II toxin-antitoxin system VapC family toxin [Alphaproteobacteria bacterium]|nr:type II toxin-antitoxin system VapC family toxin [Alphaproteobacteria bacterium]
MRLLLDTHALLWWFAGDEKLSKPARRLLEESQNEVLVSSASIWEIATKHRLGKQAEAEALLEDLEGHLSSQGFSTLPIEPRHALRAGLLPGPHRDPFDRMLIAQSLTEDIPLISNERLFDSFGVRRLW